MPAAPQSVSLRAVFSSAGVTAYGHAERCSGCAPKLAHPSTGVARVIPAAGFMGLTSSTGLALLLAYTFAEQQGLLLQLRIEQPVLGHIQ
jgi:hypothetical protein